MKEDLRNRLVFNADCGIFMPWLHSSVAPVHRDDTKYQIRTGWWTTRVARSRRSCASLKRRPRDTASAREDMLSWDCLTSRSCGRSGPQGLAKTSLYSLWSWPAIAAFATNHTANSLKSWM